MLVKVNELLDSYSNGRLFIFLSFRTGLKNLSILFFSANASSPCIIFFDELDAIVPRRQGGENQVTERVVNQLLTELDGLEQRKQIFIVAATNRPGTWSRDFPNKETSLLAYFD